MTKNFPSNLTWEHWELIPELFPEPKPGVHPPTTCMYPVSNKRDFIRTVSRMYMAGITRRFTTSVYSLWLFQKIAQRP
ncbi:Mobile element protein [Richelia intracellularis]|nr:Mobile element protein [Richelia intracellularis]